MHVHVSMLRRRRPLISILVNHHQWMERSTLISNIRYDSAIPLRCTCAMGMGGLGNTTMASSLWTNIS